MSKSTIVNFFLVRTITMLITFLTFSSLTYLPDSFVIISSPVQNISIKSNDGITNAGITLKNTSNDTITIEWVRESNTLIKGWDYSICVYGKCLPGVPEQGAFRTLKPQEEGFLKLHIIPHGITGSGSVQFKVFDKTLPDDFEILTFKVEVIE